MPSKRPSLQLYQPPKARRSLQKLVAGNEANLSTVSTEECGLQVENRDAGPTEESSPEVPVETATNVPITPPEEPAIPPQEPTNEDAQSFEEDQILVNAHKSPVCEQDESNEHPPHDQAGPSRVSSHEQDFLFEYSDGETDYSDRMDAIDFNASNNQDWEVSSESSSGRFWKDDIDDSLYSRRDEAEPEGTVDPGPKKVLVNLPPEKRCFVREDTLDGIQEMNPDFQCTLVSSDGREILLQNGIAPLVARYFGGLQRWSKLSSRCETTFDAETLESIVEFVCQGTMVLDEDNYERISLAVDYFLIDCLIEVCQSFCIDLIMKRDRDVMNFDALFNYRKASETLHSILFDDIKNFEFAMQEAPSELFLQYLTRDDIPFGSEDEVFSFIERWHQSNGTIVPIEYFFNCLRLPHMTRGVYNKMRFNYPNFVTPSTKSCDEGRLSDVPLIHLKPREYTQQHFHCVWKQAETEERTIQRFVVTCVRFQNETVLCYKKLFGSREEYCLDKKTHHVVVASNRVFYTKLTRDLKNIVFCKLDCQDSLPPMRVNENKYSVDRFFVTNEGDRLVYGSFAGLGRTPRIYAYSLSEKKIVSDYFTLPGPMLFPPSVLRVCDNRVCFVRNGVVVICTRGGALLKEMQISENLAPQDILIFGDKIFVLEEFLFNPAYQYINVRRIDLRSCGQLGDTSITGKLSRYQKYGKRDPYEREGEHRGVRRFGFQGSKLLVTSQPLFAEKCRFFRIEGTKIVLLGDVNVYGEYFEKSSYFHRVFEKFAPLCAHKCPSSTILQDHCFHLGVSAKTKDEWEFLIQFL